MAKRTARTAEISGTFGYASVDALERERRIRRVFDTVAPRYDLMNDLMSLGIHRLWKRRFARAALAGDPQRVVDLAGGTGDIAALLADGRREVLVCDPSLPMMAHGRRRGMSGVCWLAGQGERIPIASASVDAVTISFGIRNVTSLERTLAEILRVLRRGGRFHCLEFSAAWAPIRPFYNLFSFTVIPRLGAWVARSPEAYVYLVESIRRFPDQAQFKALLERAGFVEVRYRNLSFGIAAIHSGVRP